MTAPKLRLKEFDGDFKESKLVEYTAWSSGGTPSKDNEAYWGGNIPLISGVSMHTHRLYESDVKITELGLRKGSKLAPKNSILILVRGSMLFNKIPMGITLGDVAFNQDVKCIQPKQELYSNFLFQWFSAKENIIQNKVTSTGIGAGKLDTADLQNLKIVVPSIEEQTKIASFLSAVDEKISQLNQKHCLLCKYKQGMMQKLFSQQLRFKADDGSEFGEWEEIQLKDVAERVTRKNKEDNQNALTISAQMGLVNQQNYFSKQIASRDLSKYYLLHKGEFAYNKSYSAGYPMGAIKRLKLYEKGVVSTLYICFALNDQLNAGFFEHYVESGALVSELEKIAQEGARNHGLLNISLQEFFEVSFVKPCLEEQIKIANFLSAIDQKIEVAAQQIEQAKIWKKGLLQQMFV